MHSRPRRSALMFALSALVIPAGTPALRAGEAPRVTTYRNPVLPGFHPDPSVARVGEWFYLVTSSFEFFPGVPIFRSRDLVHWEQVGHVLTRDSQLPLEKAGASRGIFAPTLRWHDGTFYMVTTNVSARGNFFVTARDPAGPWSEPVWIAGQGGIDPSLLFDDDGTVYLTSTGGAPGAPSEGGIYLSTLDVASGRVLEGPRLVWKGTGGRYPEGPHLYHVRGRYYLVISEGGTEYGHMVTVARSASPWGPYEPCPRNPVLTHRNTPMEQPIQGTGHPDLVEDGEGHWWMVFLGFRPVGGGYWHHLGRETFLAPVRWDADGWPLVNEGGTIALDMKVAGLPEHVPPAPAVRDEFLPCGAGQSPSPPHGGLSAASRPCPQTPNFAGLGPAWNWLRNPVRARYSTEERAGWLTLHGAALTLAQEDSPTFVGRRQEHLRARMATRIDFDPGREGDEAGLVLYRAPFNRYELGLRLMGGRREVFVRQTVGPRLSAITATAPAPPGPLVLQVDATPGEYTLSFGPAPDRLTRLDAALPRFLSSEVAGGFVGTYVGLYATGNGAPSATPAAFDWFDYEEGKDGR